MSIKKIICAVLTLFLLLGLVNQQCIYADENPSFEFLRTEIGARPAALGGAFVGVVSDIYSLFYNPGGLAFIHKKNLSATYLNNVMDFSVGAGAYYHPLNATSGAGIGIHYFDYGEFQGKDRFGQNTGAFGANDIELIGSYGTLMREDLGLGVSIKYIQSKIAGYSALAIAGDFGVLYYLRDKNVTLGISAVNYGRSTKAFIDSKESLPSHVKVGITKQLAHIPLLVSGEIRRFTDGDLFFNGGSEFQVMRMIALRIGYSSVGRDQKLGIDGDRWSGFSFGGGVALKNMVMDYALTSLGGIGSQNRFTITANF